jgi:hypothetical protein
VKQALIAKFERVDDPDQASKLGFPSPFSSVHWDFVLSRR